MDRRKDIVEALERGLECSVAFFESLTPQQSAREIYQDGARWTGRQVVAHFITIERSMHWLFNNILSGGEGTPKNFDVDRFNKHQKAKLDRFSLEELLDQFKQVRGQTIAIVETMSESDFDREGHHAFHGHGRLERFIRWAYEHARMHEADIEKVLQEDLHGGGEA